MRRFVPLLCVWTICGWRLLAGPPVLRLAVNDPLAAENACACVEGYAQRDYHALAVALATRLRRPVEVGFVSTFAQARERMGGEPHVIVGKASQIEAELARNGHPSEACLARLTGLTGETVFQGVLVVRDADPARRVADVAGYRVIFGADDSVEKHAAGLTLLRTFGCTPAGVPEVVDTCMQAAALMAMEPADDERHLAAFVSDYALPLLTGCGTVDEGMLRVIGRTEPVPFIAAYATRHLGAEDSRAVQAALLEVSRSSRLRKRLESRDGFVRPEVLTREAGMPAAVSLPKSLPGADAVVWRRGMTAQSLGGLACDGRVLIVSDRDAENTSDVWRCLDAASGEERWTFRYSAAGEMDYTAAPRAAPVINGAHAYLLGAFGDLACVEIADGRTVWRCNLLKRYGGSVPTWGFCGTPLLVGDRLVLQVAGRKTALVALEALTGREAWRARGEGPGYGSLIHARLGARWQIVGHEAAGLCGWDPDDGRLLWRVVPPEPYDFNVPTPMRVGDLLAAATENNGFRLYGFERGGVIRPEPVGRCEAYSPQMATPVLAGGRVWGQDDGVVMALALGRDVRVCGEWHDPAFDEYATLLADDGRVLVVARNGELFLFKADAVQGDVPDRLQVFGARQDCKSTEVWSAPALTGSRLFLRSQDEAVCLALDGQ